MKQYETLSKVASIQTGEGSPHNSVRFKDTLPEVGQPMMAPSFLHKDPTVFSGKGNRLQLNITTPINLKYRHAKRDSFMSPDFEDSMKVSAHVEALLNPDNSTVASNFLGTHKSSVKKQSHFVLKTPAINRSSIEPKSSTVIKNETRIFSNFADNKQ